jgi:2-polyprenyl-6-methoxyphenol hydroxylase-like FAD-dependent oxidoreductase
LIVGGPPVGLFLANDALAEAGYSVGAFESARKPASHA